MSTEHWDAVWRQRQPEEVSWYQPEPTTSLELIGRVTDPDDAVVDVGGGASTLVDALVGAGYRDLTVVDLAAPALAAARARLGAAAGAVTWVVGDVRHLDLGRRVDLWHDRAVLHFLTDEADRRAYADALARTLRPGGHAVVATFGPDGPESCSGLPVRRYDPSALGEVLGDELVLVDHRLDVHETPSGSTQQFLYGLFRRQR